MIGPARLTASLLLSVFLASAQSYDVAIGAGDVDSWYKAREGKMSLMPAERLENRIPLMKNKGRIRAGADADLAIFDPANVQDMATYEHPARASQGVRYVLVNAAIVVDGGAAVTGVFPGTNIRAAAR